MSDQDAVEIERDECWFLKCSRSTDGILHGDNGFSVGVCEKHGVKGESFGWERFERSGGDNAAE